MVFMCQKDSYLKEFTTIVKSCERASRAITGEGKSKKEKTEGFDVELEDTILFPQGGGQPYDHGLIDDVKVLQVIRSGAKAVHFVTEEVKVGKEVKLEVDWPRRLDHMQQHSGQHLITAIADSQFGFKTTSWDLGKKVSFIELDTPQVSQQQMEEIENTANKLIRERTEVIVRTYDSSDHIPAGVRARGLPLDHVGEVRTIEIEGVDVNMCCGTHVSNLSDLQLVKLLHVEKGKKGKSNLHFIVGERVRNLVAQRWEMDKEFTKHLKCGADQYVEAVERSVKQLRLSQKNETSLLREVAMMEAERVKREHEQGGEVMFCWHRKEATNEYMNIIARNVPPQVHLLLTTGDEKGSGLFLMSGVGLSEEAMCEVSTMIGGRGKAKNGVMQGKAERMSRRKEAVELWRSKVGEALKQSLQ